MSAGETPSDDDRGASPALGEIREPLSAVSAEIGLGRYGSPFSTRNQAARNGNLAPSRP